MRGLAKKEITVIAAPVGRPPLGKSAGDTKPTLVRFEADTLARIDAACRPGEKRAALIRDAVEKELERRKR
jgi:hypothetical protein